MNRDRIGTKTLHNSMETRCETSCTDPSFVIVLENYSRVIPTKATEINLLGRFFILQLDKTRIIWPTIIWKKRWRIIARVVKP